LALKDYERQLKENKNPEFKGVDIGLDDKDISFWK
jgi:AGCS family alanine or glycine:cation symporter